MGCKPSKLQIQSNGDLFNENTVVKKSFLTGVQVSREKDGIEGNLQIAFATTRRKIYEKVANVPQALPDGSAVIPIELPDI